MGRYASRSDEQSQSKISRSVAPSFWRWYNRFSADAEDRTMSEAVREHIEIVTDIGRRKARIAGHRIRVQDVAIWHEKLGMSADEIVHHYPTITLADVYAALSYYWDHRDDIERAIPDDVALATESRRHDVGPLRRKLATAPANMRHTSCSLTRLVSPA